MLGPSKTERKEKTREKRPALRAYHPLNVADFFAS